MAPKRDHSPNASRCNLAWRISETGPARHFPGCTMFRMRGYVGVTDDRWYEFLANRPGGSGTEVNFWRPGGGGGFREETLAVGEPFFFKTHAPHNRVVGGGFYSGYAALRVSEAWELLGDANGMATQEQMLERIAH